MRILHTSDWHLGRKLKEHDRSEEFRKFLSWLEGVIADEKPDALIVSGDIFNTTTPPIESQEMYYSFLSHVAGKTCRSIIITAGNHDSAPFIDAPAGLMSRCDVHVIGRSCPGEIITLDGAVICAVPFLHDSDTGREVLRGIRSHYAEIFGKAREIRGDDDIPIIATGHLFLEAGKTLDDEGEHAMYLGTAIKVGTDIFPEDVAYVALGHLHSAQRVGRENIRYSGSPIAMTFGELGVKKSVSIVDFDGRNFAGVREIEIPVWQKMERISGDMASIERQIRELSGEASVWLEVTYTGEQSPGNLYARLAEITRDTNAEVLSVKNMREKPGTAITASAITIEDMKPREMLELYFDERGISETDREIFKRLYGEILREMEIDY